MQICFLILNCFSLTALSDSALISSVFLLSLCLFFLKRFCLQSKLSKFKLCQSFHTSFKLFCLNMTYSKQSHVMIKIFTLTLAVTLIWMISSFTVTFLKFAVLCCLTASSITFYMYKANEFENLKLSSLIIFFTALNFFNLLKKCC